MTWGTIEEISPLRRFGLPLSAYCLAAWPGGGKGLSNIANFAKVVKRQKLSEHQCCGNKKDAFHA